MAKTLKRWNGSQWVTIFDDALYRTPSFNPGDLKISCASTIAGFLLCDGTSYLTATYPSLSAEIRPTFGGVDGTHFYVPDYRGRAIIGTGTGSGLTARALGAQVGVESVTLAATESGLVGHNHTQNSHTHVQDAHTHTQDAHGAYDNATVAYRHTQDAHGAWDNATVAYRHTQDSHNHTQDAHNHSQNAHSHLTGSGGNTNAAGSTQRQPSNLELASGSTTATNQAATATNQAATATNQAATATNNATTATNGNATATNQTYTATNIAVSATAAVSSHNNMQPSRPVNIFIKT